LPICTTDLPLQNAESYKAKFKRLVEPLDGFFFFEFGIRIKKYKLIIELHV